MVANTPPSVYRALVAGLVTAGFTVLAMLTIGLPGYVALAGALGAALLVFFGLRLTGLLPQRFFGRTRQGAEADASVDRTRAVLAQADRALAELAVTVEHVRGATVQDRLLNLHLVASDLLMAVEQDPKRFDQAQSLLADWLPASSRLARVYVALEDKPSPPPEPLTRVEAMINQIDQIFATYTAHLVVPGANELDEVLQSLDDVLSEEAVGAV